MDDLLLVLALIPLAILAAFVALFVMHAQMRRRLETLEARLRLLEAHPEPRIGAAEPLAAPSAAPPEVAAPAASTALPPPLPPHIAAAAPRPPGFAQQIADWLAENWFYAVAALSLALAGIFAGQYAAERGMLPPAARLALAIGVGALLIGAGEAIRRRWGDAEDAATAYLPSVFSGAGLVTLYGAALTGQMLYGLFSPGETLAALVLVAALSVVLGWFYGPLLAAIGVIGATLAPFLAGGEAGTGWLIEGYFALVMLSGLIINAAKKWRFLDELSLALPFAAGAVVAQAMPAPAPFLCLSTLVPAIATIFIGGSLQPRLEATPVVARLRHGQIGDVAWRQWLPLLVWGAGTLGIASVQNGQESTFVEGVVALSSLFLLAAFWSRTAPAASDYPILPALGLFGLALWIGPYDLAPAGPPQIVATAFFTLLGAAALLSMAAIARSAEARGAPAFWWAAGAAVLAPGLLVAQDVFHAPAQVIGTTLWATIVLAFAALATLLAERAARRDGPDRARMSLAALAAMTLIALALFILLSKAALSVALGVLVLGAVAMDDRWKLPHLAWFAQTGVAVLAWRTLVDPGIDWALFGATYLDLFLAHAPPAAALAAAWLLLREHDRPVTRAAIEGGFALVAGTGLSLLLARALEDLTVAGSAIPQHLLLGLIGTVWSVSGWSALRTAAATPRGAGESRALTAARWLRRITGTLSFLSAAVALSMAAFPLNPIFWWSAVVLGPVGLSSLLLAYGLPGLVLLFIARETALAVWGRLVAAVAGAGLVALYLFLSVAQLWRGNDLNAVAMGDGELWSYTALLLVIGAGLLVAALLRRATWLRYLADGVLVLAIAKVFLLDAADLDGLTRAASFLILGLALAGLAWINRRAALAATGGPDTP